MMVRISQQFTRLLRRGIRTDGIVHVLLLGKEGGFATAIHTGRTGKHEILDAVSMTQLHQPRGALDVGMDVDEGILNTGTDAGPCGQVAHPLGTVGLEDVGDEGLVADVAAADGDAVGSVFVQKEGEVGLLDLGVVLVIDFIDNDNVVTTGKEMIGHVRADESRAARHEDLFVGRVRSDEGGGEVGGCVGSGRDGVGLIVLVLISGYLGGIPRRGGRARNRGSRSDGRDGRVVVVGSRGGGVDYGVVLEHVDGVWFVGSC